MIFGDKIQYHPVTLLSTFLSKIISLSIQNTQNYKKASTFSIFLNIDAVNYEL